MLEIQKSPFKVLKIVCAWRKMLMFLEPVKIWQSGLINNVFVANKNLKANVLQDNYLLCSHFLVLKGISLKINYASVITKFFITSSF